jgi:hypothetical protein
MSQYELPTSGSEPVVSGASLAPVGSPIERMRTLLTMAPDYHDDFAERPSHLTRYRYGSFLPTETSAGLIIAEEIVPEVEIVDEKKQRIYDGFTRAMDRYMSANSFVWLEDTKLMPALAGLGYRASADKTDSQGSRTITALYPSAETFNERLHSVAPDALTLVAPLDGVYPSPLAATKELAEGRFTSYSPLDMVMNASMIALLAPSVTKLMSEQAQVTVDAVEAAAALPDPDQRVYVYNNLMGLSTVLVPNNFIKAIDDPFEGRVTPTGMQELGYWLSLLVERPGFRPEDDGYSLAEDTISHISRLGHLAETNF